MYIFASRHQNFGRPRANTKKVGRLSIHILLRRCQCVGRRTCPRKEWTSLCVRPSDTGGGPTEVNRSVFTWRSYCQHITTCPTWIKNFLSTDLLGVMPKTQHTDVHVGTVSSIKRTQRKYARKWLTANTDVKKPCVNGALNEYILPFLYSIIFQKHINLSSLLAPLRLEMTYVLEDFFGQNSILKNFYFKLFLRWCVFLAA